MNAKRQQWEMVEKAAMGWLDEGSPTGNGRWCKGSNRKAVREIMVENAAMGGLTEGSRGR